MTKKTKNWSSKKKPGEKIRMKPRSPGFSIDLKSDLKRLEFHKNAFALMPVPGDKKPGVAILLIGEKNRQSFRICSCQKFGPKTCRHIRELSEVLKTAKSELGDWDFEGRFESSLWFRLAKIFFEPFRIRTEDAEIREKAAGGRKKTVVYDKKGRELAAYFSEEPDRKRFLERIDKLSKAGLISRGDVLDRLITAALNDNERELMRCGMKSRGQVFAESFWRRFFYHAFRELGGSGFTFKPEIDKKTGDFRFLVNQNGGPNLFRMTVPRSSVKSVLRDEEIPISKKKAFPIISNPVKPIVEIKKDARGCIRIYPRLRFEKRNGAIDYFTPESLAKFQYGNLVYIPGPKVFAPLVEPDPTVAEIGYPEKRVIPKKGVPDFLSRYSDFLRNGENLLDDSAAGLRVFTASDGVEISAESIGRDWCWLSVKYGYGSDKISLLDLLKARKKGERYIATSEGWVDAESEDLEALELLKDWSPPAAAAKSEDADGKKTASPDHVRLSRMDLFRLRAGAENAFQFGGETGKADLLRKFFEMRPASSPPDISESMSPLRGYQARGAEWLWFMYENGFGGLLCDEMGLGKTHQVMALMQFLRKKGWTRFLVVCPTTVISHWERKIAEHAKDLIAESYHGGERDLEKSLAACHVLITSYGIVLRDGKKLASINFPLCVFDEMQHIKNKETKTYRAAKKLNADMKIGLTGTPIENTVRELKALMDITTPGYLGDNAAFERRYAAPLERQPDSKKTRVELSRLIFPFTLRRRKASVIEELPEKIEDVRTCFLSEDQIRLYREAIETRQKGVIENLKNSSAKIPYIHIFALLTLLKQICDHPAILENNPDDFFHYESGKWELFKEILDESLESGQKVVVYSQFVRMIKIIQKYLSEKKVNAAVLTGQSRNRGQIVDRFNDDPDCRVFVGSLRAAGTGIDLVAASVVIHYDRWWNAAREDQATDRVHRIGQRRGVQVFKLVTRGTLEERISSIIEKKRDLMESVIREDDPGLLKTFTRRELLDMLSAPVV